MKDGVGVGEVVERNEFNYLLSYDLLHFNSRLDVVRRGHAVGDDS